MPRTPPPHVVGAHVRKIRASTGKVERLEARLAAAMQERDEDICAAFDAGLTAVPIHKAAHMSKDNAWRIKKEAAVRKHLAG